MRRSSCGLVRIPTRTRCASYAPAPHGVYVAPTRGRGKAIKVYCHLCGATLRSGDQYQQLDSLSHQDVVYVCRDERRCELRAAQNPLTGKPYQDPPGKAHTAQQTPTRTLA